MIQLFENYICKKQVSITKKMHMAYKFKVQCSKYQLAQANYTSSFL